MSEKKKRKRKLAEVAAQAEQPGTSASSEHSRRQFLRLGLGAAGAITAASLIGLGLHYYHSEEEEKIPPQEGPVKIGAVEQIIPKRYEERQEVSPVIRSDEKIKNSTFLAVVLKGHADLTESFLARPTRVAVDVAINATAAEPELNAFLLRHKDDFIKEFPDTFSMSDSVKEAILPVLINTARQRGMSNEALLSTADVLIQHGADPLIILQDRRQSLQLVKAVIDIMPRHDDPAHAPLLHNLMDVRDAPDGWEKIAYAIEKGVDVNQTPEPPLKNIGTALHRLIANEDTNDAVKLIGLMGDRYDPNIKDEEDKTALVIAAKVRSTKVVQALIEQYGKKLKLDESDNEGRTALHYASAYGMAAMAEALLTAGARRDVKDRQGRVPEDYLRLMAPQIRAMLASIEISADRDTGATWNAIISSDFVPFADKNGKAILATKANMETLEGEFKAAITRRAETSGNEARAAEDVAFLEKQKATMTGTTIMQESLAGHKKMAEVFDKYPAVGHGR